MTRTIQIQLFGKTQEIEVTVTADGTFHSVRAVGLTRFRTGNQSHPVRISGVIKSNGEIVVSRSATLLNRVRPLLGWNPAEVK